MATRGARGFGQYDGVARALERVGDRWALLIVRDLLVGPRRYGDLKAGLPRIPTNILSDRLRELQESGVVRRVPTTRIPARSTLAITSWSTPSDQRDSAAIAECMRHRR